MNQDTLFSLLIGGVISVSTEVEPATLISFEASFKRPLDLQQAKGGGWRVPDGGGRAGRENFRG